MCKGTSSYIKVIESRRWLFWKKIGHVLIPVSRYAACHRAVEIIFFEKKIWKTEYGCDPMEDLKLPWSFFGKYEGFL